jgi:replicative DNA helicase
MTISLEKIFFSYILKNKKYFDIVEPSFFKNAEIQFVYNIIRKYVTKNRDAEIPHPKQILEMVNLEDRDGLITKEILKALLTANTDEYDENNFIIPKMNAWILSNRLKSGTVNIIDETRNLEQKSDYEEVLSSAYKIKEIVEQMSNVNFADDEDLGSDFDDAERHSQDSSKYKIKSGFDTLDYMLGGGWDEATLNIIMAATNAGKCTFYDTIIQVRNKKNGKISFDKIGNFFSNISKGGI